MSLSLSHKNILSHHPYICLPLIHQNPTTVAILFSPAHQSPLSSQKYASELYWLNQCCKLFLIEQRARIVNVKRFYPLYLSFGSIVNTPLSSHYVSHTNTQKKNKAVNNSFSSHQQTNKQTRRHFSKVVTVWKMCLTFSCTIIWIGLFWSFFTAESGKCKQFSLTRSL